MISIQPLLPGALVALLVLASLAFVVWRLVREPGRRVAWALRVVLVLACGVLLLRPAVPGGTSPTFTSDVDVVLVVDTTASIVAEDWDGDRPRLEGVRGDVQAIVASYPGARFALIAFDADATVRVPLTSDTTALASALAVLRPEATTHSRGSSIGVAAQLVAETLRNAASVSPDRARMVFYLGDGEQTASGTPESFRDSAALVAGGGVLGYGTAEGGPMRRTVAGSAEPGEYISYEGQPALSVIDPANLERIADDLGVPYQQRRADAPAELPAAPTTSTTADGSTETHLELTWVVALVIAVLLAGELVRVTAQLVATLRVRRGRGTR